MKVGLAFSISHFFITKTARANKWMRKKIPSYSNSALANLTYLPLPPNLMPKTFCFYSHVIGLESEKRMSKAELMLYIVCAI